MIHRRFPRVLSPFFATLLILTAGCARNTATANSESEVEELIAARASLKQAMLDRDIETIEQIYTEGYGLVTRKGALRTRSERIGMIESGKLRYLRVGEESEVSIKTFGQAAVVRAVVGSSETIFDGERREVGPRRFTEIWVHENGRWQEVSRQATSIADSEELEDFVGTWNLESIEGKDESGEWVPDQDRFGADPVGYITYDSGGHMSVQIMSGDRRPFSVDDRREIPPKEAKNALLGFTAYFGTYTVDEEDKSVTHHRIGHIIPNKVTVDVKRFYQFHDDRLSLTLPSGDRRLTWRRLR
jgi:hypothetical protein